jgi:uncharacterized membrane protein
MAGGEDGAAAFQEEVAGEDSPAEAAAQAAVAREGVGDMKARDFLTKLQHDAIIKAIAAAESKTSAELQVFISRKEPEDPVAAAQKAFLQLGMEKRPGRNGVLLYVAPRARKFAIIGDREVHAQCGDDFWKEVAHEMSGYFRKSEFTEGLLHGIGRAGKLLAQHFPRH